MPPPDDTQTIADLEREIKALESETRSLLEQKMLEFPECHTLPFLSKLYQSNMSLNALAESEDPAQAFTQQEISVLQKYVAQQNSTDSRFFPSETSQVDELGDTVEHSSQGGSEHSKQEGKEHGSQGDKENAALESLGSVVISPQILSVMRLHSKDVPKHKRRRLRASDAMQQEIKGQIISTYKTQNWIDSLIQQKLYRMFGVTFFPIRNPSSADQTASPNTMEATHSISLQEAHHLLGIRFDLYDPVTRTFNKSPHYVILKSVNLRNPKDPSTDKSTLVVFKHTIPNFIPINTLQAEFLNNHDVPQVFQFSKEVSAQLRHINKKKQLFSRISQKYSQGSSTNPGISLTISYNYSITNVYFTIQPTNLDSPSKATLKFELIMNLTNVTNVIFSHENTQNVNNKQNDYIIASSNVVDENTGNVSLQSFIKILLTCDYESFAEKFDFLIDQYIIQAVGSNISTAAD